MARSASVERERYRPIVLGIARSAAISFGFPSSVDDEFLHPSKSLSRNKTRTLASRLTHADNLGSCDSARELLRFCCAAMKDRP